MNASAAASDASLSAESYSRNAPIVVSSSDSSPEGSSGTTKPVVAASAGEASMDVDAPLSGGPQLEDRHSDASSPSEEPIIRKRGRPKLSKNKKPPKVPKSKKQKKTERLEPQEPEKMKLTMKINIRDSKITESPTRAFADVEDCSVDEKQQNAEVEGVNEKELNEKKPSTQPVALVGFKIPKKRKASVEDIKGTSDRPPKVRYLCLFLSVISTLHNLPFCIMHDCGIHFCRAWGLEGPQLHIYLLQYFTKA